MILSTIADPDTLAKAVEKMRTDALFIDKEDDGTIFATPIVEQHFLLGLAALETAQRHFAMAELIRKGSK